MDSLQLFTISYFLFSFCIIFPIPVFVSCGLTVDKLFAKFLGSERKSFTRYQLRRIVATIITHASLPLGYVLLRLYIDKDFNIENSLIWQTVLVGSLTLSVGVSFKMYIWAMNNWEMHPVTCKLRLLCGDHALNDVINDIDNDFIRPDTTIIHSNPTSKVILSEKWIIKTSSYDLDIVLQNDADLEVLSADEHDTLASTQGSCQFLNIKVTSSRPDLQSFNIRVNSVDFKEFQNFINQPIKITDHIKIKSTILDHFLVFFKEQVELNPTVTLSINGEQCHACYEKRPNVKLMKTCGDESISNRCVSCLCTSLWCVDCIGSWFAIRQDQEAPQKWMSSKGTCPMCRCTFCVLDVCRIKEVESEES